jgi:hypothetical protein
MGHDPDVQRIIAEDPRTTAAYTGQRPLDGGAQKVDDISNALLWISSDEARMVTGITLPIDAGAAMR